MKEETLLSLLKKKKSFFEAILDLTEQESHSTLTHWEELLQKKKILLCCIEDIDDKLQQFANCMHDLSYEVSEELVSMRQIIMQIMHLSANNIKEKKNRLT